MSAKGDPDSLASFLSASDSGEPSKLSAERSCSCSASCLCDRFASIIATAGMFEVLLRRDPLVESRRVGVAGRIGEVVEATNAANASFESSSDVADRFSSFEGESSELGIELRIVAGRAPEVEFRFP